MSQRHDRSVPRPAEKPADYRHGQVNVRYPSPPLLCEIFDHERWLRSEGRHGRRLEIHGPSNRSIFVWKRPDLNAVDFSKALLENVVFDGASLKAARFKDAELHGVQFSECDVAGADFTGAKCEDVSFNGSNYRQAHFDNVDTAHVHWEGQRPVYKRYSNLNSTTLRR